MKRALFVALCIPLLLSAQKKQYNVWYFGAGDSIGVTNVWEGFGAGLDFNSGSPTTGILNSAMKFTEGSAVQCDEQTGRLLFYTDGTRIWDSTHNYMMNGDSGIGGHPSSTQNSVIIPIPRMSGKYAVFGNDGLNTGTGQGLRLAIVDMERNGGLGAVTGAKSIGILPNTSEKITAIRHANGHDFWILTTLCNTNDFYAYLFTTPDDIDNPDLSCFILDTVISNGPSLTCAGQYFKASPKGNKIAFSGGNIFYTMDFDNATGILSKLDTIFGPSADLVKSYSFSPDGNFLYATQMPANAVDTSFLYQYDMQNANPSATELKIGGLTIQNNPNVLTYLFPSDIQIGPDGKLYMSYMVIPFLLNPGQFPATFLDVLPNPNIAGIGAGPIQPKAVDLLGRHTWFGFPNLIADYLIFDGTDNLNKPSGGFTASVNCFGDTTNFIDSSFGAYVSWNWDFDDPTSGVNNNSTDQNPKHLFSAVGTYNVQVIAGLPCISDTFIFSVSITQDSTPIADAGLDTSICAGFPVIIGGSPTNNPGTVLLWSPSNGLSSTTDPNPIATVDTTTTYYVSVSNSCGVSPPTLDTVIVNVFDALNINAGDSLAICPGMTNVILGDSPTVSGGNMPYLYIWSPAISLNDSSIANPTASPIVPTIYQLLVSDSNGCTAYDSVFIDFVIQVSAGSDTAICFGESIILGKDSVGSTYSWTPQADLSCDNCPNPTANPSSDITYIVTVVNSVGCVNVDSISVIVYPLLNVLSGSGDTTIKSGTSVQLRMNASGTFSWTPPTWLDNPNSSNPTSTPDSTITYYITQTSIDGCSTTDSFTIYVINELLIFPNSFTPNNDGLNDEFKIFQNGLKTLNYFKIYNRWGQTVYFSKDLQAGWDGNYNGKPQEIGTYHYEFSAVNFDGNAVSQSGTIALIR